MEELESKMEIVQWKEITGESLTGYLAEQGEEKATYNFHLKEEEQDEEEDIVKEVKKLLREYQDIVSKGDHDIENCNIVKHAIRLTDDISTTC